MTTGRAKAAIGRFCALGEELVGAGATDLGVEGLNDEERLGGAQGLGSTEHQGNLNKFKHKSKNSKQTKTIFEYMVLFQIMTKNQ